MDIFTSIFTRIEATLVTGLSSGTANLMNLLSPVLLAAFVVYVMFVVWSYWANAASIEATFVDLIKRIFIWGVIIGFSVNLGSYNANVMPLVMGLGDGLSQTFTGSPASNASSLDALAGQITDLVNTNAQKAYETPGVAPKIVSVLNTTFNNAMILISSFILLVVAGAYLILIKVMLAMLVVLGPVFLAFLLFPATRQWGANWIAQVLNYSLLALLLNIAVGFFITYVDGVLSSMTTGAGLPPHSGAIVLDGVIGMTGVAQIVLATILFVIILWQLPQLTSSLVGGLAAGGYGQAVNAARMGKQLSSKGGGGGGSRGGNGGSMKRNAASTPEASGR